MNSALFDNIICLVGENPLPVYLGIQEYAADNAVITLVHSAQTAEQAARTVDTLNADNAKSSRSRQCVLKRLDDAYSHSSVESLVRSLHVDGAALNYTGGTKVMAAFAVKAWPDPKTVFYLQESEQRFRFGDGLTEPFERCTLTVAELCLLHRVLPHAFSPVPRHDGDDLIALWAKFGGSTPIPYRADQWKYMQDQPEAHDREWQTVLQTLTPLTRAEWQKWPRPTSRNAYKNSQYGRAVEWASTLWLESTATHFSQLAAPAASVVQARHFSVERQQFECDGLVVYKNRLYYISASTTKEKGLLKSKMFEAVYRARQIGGGLARSCVVSLADQTVCDECYASLGSDPHMTFFSRDNVGAWFNGDLKSLKDFLEA